MPAQRRSPSVVLGLVAATLVLAAAAARADLTPQERQGKQIYLLGTSTTGQDITALMGEAGVEVPASALPCANCHGRDGKGKAEGGVVPSNLTWDALTKSYGVRHESGREHPPYTEPLLKRAITMGIDPAGNKLHVAMPRYQMSQEDMGDLVAYLKKLGQDRDPGLEDKVIRLGTLLPPGGTDDPTGAAIESVLSAYFEDVNADGGLYGRQVDFVSFELPADPSARKAAVASFLEDRKVFALVGAFLAGADVDLSGLMAEKEVPLIGPFTLHPQLGFPLNRQVFYTYSGLASQCRALLDFAAGRRPNGAARAAVIYPEDGYNAAVVEALDKQAVEQAWLPIDHLSYAPGEFDAGKLVEHLAKNRQDVVFFLDSGGRGLELLKAGDRLGWRPEVFLPGSLAGRDIFEAPEPYHERVFLSFPTLPTDQSPQGVKAYRKLADEHKLATDRLPIRLATFVAAQVLVDGLKQAGRDVSREKLITALEGFYDYDTGLTPKMSFGPNRRIGALGAYIVTVDLKQQRFVPTSTWIHPR